MKKEYRRGVGIFLINQENKLWVGKRIDLKSDYWQMPQGGIDALETPEIAMRRELMEEVGLQEGYKIIGKTKDWLRYHLPEDLVKIVWQGKYIGQKQIWFACRFFGNDNQINIDKDDKPEFSCWKWINPFDATKFVVPFKKELYGSILKQFGKHLD